MSIEFTDDEKNILIQALNLLARQQQDTIQAALQLAPIRLKLSKPPEPPKEQGADNASQPA